MRLRLPWSRRTPREEAQGRADARPLEAIIAEHRARVSSLMSTLDGVRGYTADAMRRTEEVVASFRRSAGPEDRFSAFVALASERHSHLEDRRLLAMLAREFPPLDHARILLLLRLAEVHRRSWIYPTVLRAPIAAAERLRTVGEDVALRAELRRTLAGLPGPGYSAGDVATLRARLIRVLAEPEGLDLSPISDVDGWGRCVREWLSRDHRRTPHVSELLVRLASATTGPNASAKWARRFQEIAAQQPLTGPIVRRLLEDVARAGRAMTAEPRYRGHPPWVSDVNNDIVRGCCWAAGVLAEPWAVPLLLAVADEFPKEHEKVPNSCYATLGAVGTAEAVAGLAHLKARETHRGHLKHIEAALDLAARNAGMTASELLERTVPTHGLDAGGFRRLSVGDHLALISVSPRGAVDVTWSGPGGTELRRRPASLAPSPELTAFKETLAELKRDIVTEVGRLESLISESREWACEAWADHYLRHPLTAPLASGLIWLVKSGEETFSGIPIGEGAFRTASGDVRAVDTSSARIAPWHPIQRRIEDIESWRAHLLDHSVVQPFKQAYREVYLLAPAEERTGTYSNRFAAHVVRYGQLYALLKQRRWATNYLGDYDGGYEGKARRDFREHAISASFYFDPCETDGELRGAPELCTTDQVRFARLGGQADDPLPLADVPAIVFSEAMRDVDLFVSVTSIAADPAWLDRGTDRYRAYWERTAFGPLAASARVRREALERIVPRLRIASRCRIEGDYLHVRGDLSSYKIHIGSAAVKLVPNDQYLCVVEGKGPSGMVFLPFEEDGRLSVVLSKAFLLADDRKIRDKTILQQLERSGIPIAG